MEEFRELSERNAAGLVSVDEYTAERTRIFEALGIAPPETFDEVMAAAKAVTESSDYPDVSGYAMNFKRGAAAGQQYFEWIYSAGGKPWESNFPGSAQGSL